MSPPQAAWVQTHAACGGLCCPGLSAHSWASGFPLGKTNKSHTGGNGSMGQAQATKTIRQSLEHRHTPSLWFATTQTLFNAVAAFYWQVLDAHPSLLDLSAKDALTALERLTLTTASSPAPVMPLSEVAAQVPALFRRAAIHAALGSMHSFQAHLARWQRTKQKAEAKGKRCQVRPPVPRG